MDIYKQGVSGKRITFSKGELEYRDRVTSFPRTLGAVAGGAGLVYTVPRTRVVGGIIGHGTRHPNGQARTLAAAAMRAQRDINEATTPIGRHARELMSRSHAGRDALKLPRTTRVGIATLGSYGLLRASLPIRSDKYRTVRGAPSTG